jgi:hypothetical protein
MRGIDVTSHGNDQRDGRSLRHYITEFLFQQRMTSTICQLTKGPLGLTQMKVGGLALWWTAPHVTLIGSERGRWKPSSVHQGYVPVWEWSHRGYYKDRSAWRRADRTPGSSQMKDLAKHGKRLVAQRVHEAPLTEMKNKQWLVIYIRLTARLVGKMGRSRKPLDPVIKVSQGNCQSDKWSSRKLGKAPNSESWC